MHLITFMQRTKGGLCSLSQVVRCSSLSLSQVFDFELSEDDMKTLLSMNNNYRGFPMMWWADRKKRTYRNLISLRL